SSRGLSAMKRMRPSAAAGCARDSASHSAGGAATEIAETVSSWATKSARCCSHSCEWPSASGSRISTSLGKGSLPRERKRFDAVHQMAKDERLGIVPLDELTAASAQLLAQAGVVGEPGDRIGEARRVIRRHTDEGTALMLQPPQLAVGKGGGHE